MKHWQSFVLGTITCICIMWEEVFVDVQELLDMTKLISSKQ